ncbi:hypothetical protein HGRIS_011389 [Hohenbuehelia grisea]|uniref:Transcription factor domain-containing protein n=1 Tax=Hohenbuehelia grisea TaxID=104357 RepID=A0ABR3JVR7_9AGAR
MGAPPEVPSISLTSSAPPAGTGGYPTAQASSRARYGARHAEHDYLHPEDPVGHSSSSSSSSGYHSSVNAATVPESGGSNEEPAHHEISTLLDSFLGHAREFGFFLNIQRFHATAYLQLPLGHHARPAAALLSTAYLIGAATSRSNSLRARERVFLMDALRRVEEAPTSRHPQSVLHGLQAQVLLANYFFQNGRFLEGRRHAAAAFGMAMSLGLHRSQPVSSFVNPEFSSLIGNDLGASIDSESEREHVNAFWASYCINNYWTAALGSPITPGAHTVIDQADIRWPTELPHEQTAVAPAPSSSSAFTIRRFLDGFGSNQQGATSPVALVAKASILFERSAWTAGQYRSGQHNRQALDHAFSLLDGLIENLKTHIVSVDQALQSSTPPLPIVVLTHTLAHAAMIQLHSPFTAANAPSHGKSLTAAEFIVYIANHDAVRALGYVDPIIAVRDCFLSL